MASGGETFYERLGVSRTASAAEVRAAYLHLVSQLHPDRHEGNPLSDLAEEKLAQVNAAYEVLSDPARRAAYDAGLAGDAVSRPAPILKLAVRLGLGLVAFLLLLRLVPLLWRTVRAALAPLAGTPAVPLAVLALVLGLAVFAGRRRKRRAGGRSRRP